MQKRLKLGKVDLPLGALVGYALSGCLLVADGTLAIAYIGLRALAIVVFLGAAVAHICDKIDRNTLVVEEKIDDSVGDVWDAGQESGRRNERLEADKPPTLATVHDLAGR